MNVYLRLSLCVFFIRVCFSIVRIVRGSHGSIVYAVLSIFCHAKIFSRQQTVNKRTKGIQKKTYLRYNQRSTENKTPSHRGRPCEAYPTIFHRTKLESNVVSRCFFFFFCNTAREGSFSLSTCFRVVRVVILFTIHTHTQYKHTPQSWRVPFLGRTAYFNVL